ncbi:MAG: HdeD family acid-resistance protein [Fimbriimonadaceae bacterium]|nr:HdeD family acid-resistance protein [Fimbriimonadaceae bacterium]
MIQLLRDNWWLFVVRGVLAIVFGIVAFVRPDVALAALVALYGFFALTDGVVSLAGCFLFAGTRLVWWMLLEGLFGIAAGVLAFTMPGATAMLILTLLGVWLIASGAVRTVLAIEMRQAVGDAWLAAVSGLCAVLAGILTIVSPLQSAVAWMYIMGASALIVGAVTLSLGVSLRRSDGLGSRGATTA